MHPLATDLSNVSDDDLYLKYNDLSKKYTQAYRFGPTSIIPQIQMMMEHYRAEMSERLRRQTAEISKKMAEDGKVSKNGDGPLNIS